MVKFSRKEDENPSILYISKMLDSLPFTNRHHILRVFPNEVIKVSSDKFGILVYIELDSETQVSEFPSRVKMPKL